MDISNLISNSLQTTGEADYLLVIISFIFCIATSYILMGIYISRSDSLSSKIQIAKIIPLLANITFLVILIVKSSLALSLGLVGALSVIRFRTPIKEPEDLAFLFFAIALGIGFGALQIQTTTIIFIILILVIIFLPSFNKKEIQKTYNLIIQHEEANNQEFINDIIKQLDNFCDASSFIKIEKDQSSTYLYFNVLFKDLNSIQLLVDRLDNNSRNLKYSIYGNTLVD
jgi:hypothetical protein